MIAVLPSQQSRPVGVLFCVKASVSPRSSLSNVPRYLSPRSYQRWMPQFKWEALLQASHKQVTYIMSQAEVFIRRDA